MKHLVAALIVALLSGTQAHAQAPGRDGVIAERPWARATPGGARTGAVYVSLTNTASDGDRLTGAVTPVADRIQFHAVTEENGVSHMREMQAVEIAPGGRVDFSPGGMHIMLVGLKQPLKEGQAFPLTLIFANAGKVEVTVPVAKVGAMQPGGTVPSMHETGHSMK